MDSDEKLLTLVMYYLIESNSKNTTTLEDVSAQLDMINSRLDDIERNN